MTYTNLYLATTTKKQLNQLTGSHYPNVQSWFRQHIFSTEVKENRQCRRDTESGDLQTAKLYLKQTHPGKREGISVNLCSNSHKCRDWNGELKEEKYQVEVWTLMPLGCTGYLCGQGRRRPKGTVTEQTIWGAPMLACLCSVCPICQFCGFQNGLWLRSVLNTGCGKTK